jgi:hypothetical protein
MFNFAPHKEKFFDLFKEAAENALAGAKALKEMLTAMTILRNHGKKSGILSTKATAPPTAPSGA